MCFSSASSAFQAHEELAWGRLTGRRTRAQTTMFWEELPIPQSVIDALQSKRRRSLIAASSFIDVDRPPPAVMDTTGDSVDDGRRTGQSMRAAVTALRQLHPAKIVVAVRSAPREKCADCQTRPARTLRHGHPTRSTPSVRVYGDFRATSDDEVGSCSPKRMTATRPSIQSFQRVTEPYP